MSAPIGHIPKWESQLANLRKAKQISQRDLANAVGVSENTISSWEKAFHHSFVIGVKICDFFEDEIEELYDPSDNLREIHALREIGRLRKAPARGEISQRELAQAIDVTENTISTWESGKHTTVDKLEKLCICLGCRLFDLCRQQPHHNDSPRPKYLIKKKRRHRQFRNTRIITISIPLSQRDSEPSDPPPVRIAASSHRARQCELV